MLYRVILSVIQSYTECYTDWVLYRDYAECSREKYTKSFTDCYTECCATATEDILHYLIILTGAAADSRQLNRDATKPNNTKSHTEAGGKLKSIAHKHWVQTHQMKDTLTKQFTSFPHTVINTTWHNMLTHTLHLLPGSCGKFGCALLQGDRGLEVGTLTNPNTSTGSILCNSIEYTSQYCHVYTMVWLCMMCALH